MSKINSLVKCKFCGFFSANSENCKNCGALISFKKEKKLKEEAFVKKQIELAKIELENPGLAIRLIRHPFFMYRIAGWILHSVFFVISAIGAFLAWFIAMVAAG